MQILSRANERRLAELTEVLATPLAYGSREEWYAAATRAVRGFFRGDSVFLCTPDRGARLYFEDDQPMFSDELDAWIAYRHGEVTSADTAFDRGFVACRQRRLSTFTSTIIDQIIGNQLRHSVVYNDILRPAGARVSIGCGGITSFGEVMCAIDFETASPNPFAIAMRPLLALIVPLLAAGYETVQRLDSGRAAHAAWLEALDGASDGCLVYDTERHQEIHHNAALAAMQRSDTEGDIVIGAMQRIACSMSSHQGSPGESASSALAAAALAQSHQISTARGRYMLRATLLPAGTCSAGPSVLVLARRSSATLPLAIELRARFGLTRREADVALHLAAGMTDEAIARRIGVSSHTARHHSEHVLVKLGLRSRKGLGLFLVHSC
ncbi:MAG: response regulator transcription factor [Gemmatimonadaceae bacterium]